jgi:hypothetical protein
LPNEELLIRIDERVKTLFDEIRDMKDDVKLIKLGVTTCPFGAEAHATVVKDIEALKKEQDELRGGRRVAYIIAGAGITIVGIMIGFFI